MSKRDQVIETIQEKIPVVNEKQAGRLYDAAKKGGELDNFALISDWIDQRLAPGIIVLSRHDYLTALTRSLPVAMNLAGTDYGTTRQRDLGQLWTDTARGFMGEIAFRKFISGRFGVELLLDYTLGPLEDYLPMDITVVVLPDGRAVEPGVKISVKTAKFNGLWLDIPGAQIEHSDAFVFVRIGVEREHFVAFLKDVSFIKDKLLPLALSSEIVDEEAAQEIWDIIPEFEELPSYIVGFLDKELISSPPDPQYRETRFRDGSFKGYMMQGYVGMISKNKPFRLPEDLREKAWNYEAIGSFSIADHFIANAGSLKYREGEWQELVNKIAGVQK